MASENGLDNASIEIEEYGSMLKYPMVSKGAVENELTCKVYDPSTVLIIGVFDSNRRDMLKKLANSTNDATGKEDLLIYLCMLALQKVASEYGYNKLVLGSCISRIACHVISAIMKGQGYSLPVDI